MTDQFKDGCGKPQPGDKKDESEYKVGYRKPPRNTQFKKGQSGNPKGRRKGGKNVGTIMKDALNCDVTITENGRPRKVKYMEAFIKQLMAKALNGSTRDQIALLKAIHDYAPELLRVKETEHLVTVQYVLPDGKTVEDYDNQAYAQKMWSIEDRPDLCDDEDDSWLN